MYATFPISRLRTLRTTFLAALARPNLANRAKVERYLASVERQLVIAAGPMAAPAPGQRASLHDLRTGKAPITNATDADRVGWSFYS